MLYWNVLTIRVICVGGITDYYATAISKYEKRLRRYCKFEIIPANAREDDLRGQIAAIRAQTKGHIILCDIDGELISSEGLAQRIDKLSQNTSTITFIIGGSDGVGDMLNDVVHERISFGKITLPHQLFRVALVEQIYRAFTILRGEKYHK